jgi:hypothetical protein
MLCKICKKKEASEDGRCLYYACSPKTTNHFKDDAIKGKFKIVTPEGVIVMRTNYMSRIDAYLKQWGKKKGHKLVK